MDHAQFGVLNLVATAFATYFFTAIIWYTHILGYPLWRWVGKAEFPALHREYLRRLPLIVQLPYTFLIGSNGLLFFFRPTTLSRGPVAVLFLLHALVLIVSVAFAGPLHGRLQTEEQCTPDALRRLLFYNSIRVLLMATSSAIVSLLLFHMLLLNSS